MPKKFRFRLQPVMDHRQRIEDAKKQAMAVCQRALDEARRELERLNDDFRRDAADVRSRHRELDVDELQLRYAHLQYLDRAIDAQMRVVAERRVALDRARGELLAAQKDRKVIERLRERRAAAHRLEAERYEQRELDDANARAYGRVTHEIGSAS